MNDRPLASVIIPAAGSGVRMGADKMLAELDSMTVIARTVKIFDSLDFVGEIIIVASRKNIDVFLKETKKYGINKKIIITEGGTSRGESSLCGIKKASYGIVMIHDGARPFLTRETAEKAYNAALIYGAAAPAVTPRDTVKRINDGFINETIERSETVLVQTPQVFNKDCILAAYEKVGTGETDDCAVAEKYGIKVRLVEGDYDNIKLTIPTDLALGHIILNKNKRHPHMRIGTGFDSHRLEYRRRLILGGVEIPYEKGLLGHSDADALIHAIIDALFGAAALGDIGSHYPDTNNDFKDISSIELLRDAVRIVTENGYFIGNVDATIIVQQPKMAQYIMKMRENIASAMGLDITDVSIKAKTNEKMGFTGRSEGIEARAAVLLG